MDLGTVFDMTTAKSEVAWLKLKSSLSEVKETSLLDEETLTPLQPNGVVTLPNG